MVLNLKEKFGVGVIGIINATKQTYKLLTHIFTLISYFELPNGCSAFNNLKIYAHSGRCVAIFLHEHTITRPATMTRRENNKTALFSYERYDVISLISLN